jgi:hypothetical protein
LPEWDLAEPLVKGLSKALGNSIYKGGLLNSSFKDASSFVWRQIHAHRAEHVDWRWETLEEVADFHAGFLPTFTQFFKPEDLAEAPSVCKGCVEATKTVWLTPFLVTIHVFLASVGVEASKLEGCVCHQCLLLQEKSYAARKQLVADATGTEDSCPWAGKWGCAFALGYAATMCQRIGSGTTARYQTMLATSSPEIRGRMVTILTQLNAGIISTIKSKFDFYMHIPHRIAGGFGKYFGYTLEESKQCVEKCFEEWDQIANKDNAHRVCFHLFDSASSVSLQLEAFYQTPMTELWDYIDAFEEVQDTDLLLQ